MREIIKIFAFRPINVLIIAMLTEEEKQASNKNQKAIIIIELEFIIIMIINLYFILNFNFELKLIKCVRNLISSILTVISLKIFDFFSLKKFSLLKVLSLPI